MSSFEVHEVNGMLEIRFKEIVLHVQDYNILNSEIIALCSEAFQLGQAYPGWELIEIQATGGIL
jgi:hypothetical protein